MKLQNIEKLREMQAKYEMYTATTQIKIYRAGLFPEASDIEMLAEDLEILKILDWCIARKKKSKVNNSKFNAIQAIKRRLKND